MTATLREVHILPGPFGCGAYLDHKAARINATLRRAETLRAQAAALRALAEEYEAGRVPTFLAVPQAGADAIARAGAAIHAPLSEQVGEAFHGALAKRLRDRAAELVAAAEEAAAAAVGLRAASLAEGGSTADLEPIGAVRAFGVREDGSPWAEMVA